MTKKEYIKNAGKANRVKELVQGLDMKVEDAINLVYDELTLSHNDFIDKYFG